MIWLWISYKNFGLLTDRKERKKQMKEEKKNQAKYNSDQNTKWTELIFVRIEMQIPLPWIDTGIVWIQTLKKNNIWAYNLNGRLQYSAKHFRIFIVKTIHSQAICIKSAFFLEHSFFSACHTASSPDANELARCLFSMPLHMNISRFGKIKRLSLIVIAHLLLWNSMKQ